MIMMTPDLLKKPKTFGIRPASAKLLHDLARRADVSDSAMLDAILKHIANDKALAAVLVMEAKVTEE